MAKRKKRKVWPIVLVNGELTRAARRALRPARLEREVAMCHMKVVAYKADYELITETLANHQALETLQAVREEWYRTGRLHAETLRLLGVLQFEQQRRARAASLQKYVDGVYKAVAEREAKGEINGQSPHRP